MSYEPEKDYRAPDENKVIQSNTVPFQVDPSMKWIAPCPEPVAQFLIWPIFCVRDYFLTHNFSD